MLMEYLGDGAILHKKFYFNILQMSVVHWEIDVFGLSGLQVQHLINFILFWG